MKIRLLTAAAVYPFLWLAGFYGLALRVRLELGRWPHYAHPDPKDIDFVFHYLLLAVGLLAMPVLGFAASSLGLFSRLRCRDVPWLAAAAPLLTAAAAIALLKADPGNFMEWFLD